MTRENLAVAKLCVKRILSDSGASIFPSSTSNASLTDSNEGMLQMEVSNRFPLISQNIPLHFY